MREVMAIRGKGKRAIQAFIDEGKEFNHETLKGVKITDPRDIGQGDMPAEPYKVMLEDEPVAVVFSYRTPIAWRGAYGWVIPDVYYSRTTQNHQSVVRVAVGNVGFYEGARY